MSSSSGSMFRRLLCGLLLAALLAGCGQDSKSVFLPTASNDSAFAVIGFTDTETDPEAGGPTVDKPEKSVPGKDAPKKDTPEKDLPGKDAPEKDLPGKDTPAAGTPEKKGAGADAPAEPVPPKDGGLLLPSDDGPAQSVTAQPVQPTYPVGSSSVQLTVTNQSENNLLYTTVFDLRKLSPSGEWLPLDGAAPTQPQEELELAGGETTIVEAVLNPVPTEPGRYRLAQLACFSDPQGKALACTGIEAEFELVLT